MIQELNHLMSLVRFALTIFRQIITLAYFRIQESNHLMLLICFALTNLR